MKMKAFGRIATGLLRLGAGAVARRSKSWILAVVAALTLHLASVPAEAGTVTATFTGVNPNESVTIRRPDGNSLGTSAGVYNLNATASSPVLTGIPGNLLAFCIDVYEGINGSSNTFTTALLENSPVNSPPGNMLSTKANLIRQLWLGHIGNVSGAISAYIANPTGANQAAANLNAAAFQLAVWEIVNETIPAPDGNGKASGYELDSGVVGTRGLFYASGNAPTLSLANSWLDGLSLANNGLGAGGNMNLLALTNSGLQDYVVEIPGGPGTLVDTSPAPPGLLLGLVGALGLVVSSAARFRKRLATGAA